MPKKSPPKLQGPLILRLHRLIEAFSKAGDERDFVFDSTEGFILYMDLDASEEDLQTLSKEIDNESRYLPIPKMSFFEARRIMEAFVNDKIYDIDAREKLLDISKKRHARRDFLLFLDDLPAEMEKWKPFYHSCMRIRVIEWLRKHSLSFVFEEELSLDPSILEKLKQQQFTAKLPKSLAEERKALIIKSKIYYSNEALHPRPRRGRPPKHINKAKPAITVVNDHLSSVPKSVEAFLLLSDFDSNDSNVFSPLLRDELKAIQSPTPVEEPEQLKILSEKLEELHKLNQAIRLARK